MYIPLVIFHYNMYTAYWAPMPIHCINDDGLKIYSESPWPLPSSFVKIRVVLLKAFADPSINHESQGLLQAKKLTKPSTMSFKRIHGRHMRCQKGHMEDKRSDMMWYDVIYTWMGNTGVICQQPGRPRYNLQCEQLRRLLVKTSWHSPFWGTVLIKPCQRSMWCFRCLYPC